MTEYKVLVTLTEEQVKRARGYGSEKPDRAITTAVGEAVREQIPETVPSVALDLPGGPRRKYKVAGLEHAHDTLDGNVVKLRLGHSPTGLSCALSYRFTPDQAVELGDALSVFALKIRALSE